MKNEIEKVKKKSMVKLSGIVQKDLMSEWTTDNYQHFCEAMEVIRENAPVEYAKLYLKTVQLTTSQERNININVSRQHDFDQLMGLSQTKVVPALKDESEAVPFEELMMPGLPKIPKRKEGDD